MSKLPPGAVSESCRFKTDSRSKMTNQSPKRTFAFFADLYQDFEKCLSQNLLITREKDHALSGRLRADR
jgi:hypothetical protein